MNVRKMSLCAMFAALLCICAWIAVPIGDISVTLQTFGVFLALGLLGGKYGTVTILIYLLLGAVGLPVFSGFRGGPGVLLGVTGGYLWGFLASGLSYLLLTRLGVHRTVAMTVGLLVCYTLGSLWYLAVYLRADTVSLTAVLLKCVVPYLLPDGLKLLLASWLTGKLAPFIK